MHVCTAGSIVATCLFVLAFVKALNFLDGSDGLAADIAGIVALAFIFAPGFSHDRFGDDPMAWSVAGACAAGGKLKARNPKGFSWAIRAARSSGFCSRF